MRVQHLSLIWQAFSRTAGGFGCGKNAARRGISKGGGDLSLRGFVRGFRGLSLSAGAAILLALSAGGLSADSQIQKESASGGFLYSDYLQRTTSANSRAISPNLGATSANSGAIVGNSDIAAGYDIRSAVVGNSAILGNGNSVAAGNFDVDLPKSVLWADGKRVAEKLGDAVESLPLREWLMDYYLAENADIAGRFRTRVVRTSWDLADLAAEESLLAATEGARAIGFVRTIEVDLQSSLGGRFGNLAIDALGAIRETETEALAWQLRGYYGGKDEAEKGRGANFGVLYRRAAGAGALVGANVFYDIERRDGFDYSRWSLGGEFRSAWASVFANYYLSGDDVTFGTNADNERTATYSASGYDLELNLSAPEYPWLVGVAQYYLWEGEYGRADDEGYRAGVRFSPLTFPLRLELLYQSGEEGRDIGWNLAYRYNIGGDNTSAAANRGEFRAQDHFFDPARREYTQRIYTQVIPGGGSIYRLASISPATGSAVLLDALTLETLPQTTLTVTGIDAVSLSLGGILRDAETARTAAYPWTLPLLSLTLQTDNSTVVLEYEGRDEDGGDSRGTLEIGSTVYVNSLTVSLVAGRVSLAAAGVYELLGSSLTLRVAADSSVAVEIVAADTTATPSVTLNDISDSGTVQIMRDGITMALDCSISGETGIFRNCPLETPSVQLNSNYGADNDELEAVFTAPGLITVGYLETITPDITTDLATIHIIGGREDASLSTPPPEPTALRFNTNTGGLGLAVAPATSPLTSTITIFAINHPTDLSHTDRTSLVLTVIVGDYPITEIEAFFTGGPPQGGNNGETPYSVAGAPNASVVVASIDASNGVGNFTYTESAAHISVSAEGEVHLLESGTGDNIIYSVGDTLGVTITVDDSGAESTRTDPVFLTLFLHVETISFTALSISVNNVTTAISGDSPITITAESQSSVVLATLSAFGGDGVYTFSATDTDDIVFDSVANAIILNPRGDSSDPEGDDYQMADYEFAVTLSDGNNAGTPDVAITLYFAQVSVNLEVEIEISALTNSFGIPIPNPRRARVVDDNDTFRIYLEENLFDTTEGLTAGLAQPTASTVSSGIFASVLVSPGTGTDTVYDLPTPSPVGVYADSGEYYLSGASGIFDGGLTGGESQTLVLTISAARTDDNTMAATLEQYVVISVVPTLSVTTTSRDGFYDGEDDIWRIEPTPDARISFAVEGGELGGYTFAEIGSSPMQLSVGGGGTIAVFRYDGGTPPAYNTEFTIVVEIASGNGDGIAVTVSLPAVVAYPPLSLFSASSLQVQGGGVADGSSGSPYYTNSHFAVLATLVPEGGSGIYGFETAETGISLNLQTRELTFANRQLPATPGTTGYEITVHSLASEGGATLASRAITVHIQHGAGALELAVLPLTDFGADEPGAQVYVDGGTIIIEIAASLHEGASAIAQNARGLFATIDFRPTGANLTPSPLGDGVQDDNSFVQTFAAGNDNEHAYGIGGSGGFYTPDNFTAGNTFGATLLATLAMGTESVSASQEVLLTILDSVSVSVSAPHMIRSYSQTSEGVWEVFPDGETQFQFTAAGGNAGGYVFEEINDSPMRNSNPNALIASRAFVFEDPNDPDSIPPLGSTFTLSVRVISGGGEGLAATAAITVTLGGDLLAGEEITLQFADNDHPAVESYGDRTVPIFVPLSVVAADHRVVTNFGYLFALSAAFHFDYDTLDPVLDPVLYQLGGDITMHAPDNSPLTVVTSGNGARVAFTALEDDNPATNYRPLRAGTYTMLIGAVGTLHAEERATLRIRVDAITASVNGGGALEAALAAGKDGVNAPYVISRSVITAARNSDNPVVTLFPSAGRDNDPNDFSYSVSTAHTLLAINENSGAISFSAVPAESEIGNEFDFTVQVSLTDQNVFGDVTVRFTLQGDPQDVITFTAAPDQKSGTPVFFTNGVNAGGVGGQPLENAFYIGGEYRQVRNFIATGTDTSGALQVVLNADESTAGYTLQKVDELSSPELVVDQGRIQLAADSFPRFGRFAQTDSIYTRTCSRIVLEAAPPAGETQLHNRLTVHLIRGPAITDTPGTINDATICIPTRNPSRFRTAGDWDTRGIIAGGNGTRNNPWVIAATNASLRISVAGGRFGSYTSTADDTRLARLGLLGTHSQVSVSRSSNTPPAADGTITDLARILGLHFDLPNLNAQEISLTVYLDDQQTFNRNEIVSTLYFTVSAGLSALPAGTSVSVVARAESGNWEHDDDTTLADEYPPGSPIYDYTLIGNYGEARAFFNGTDNGTPALRLVIPNLDVLDSTVAAGYSFKKSEETSSPHLGVTEDGAIVWNDGFFPEYVRFNDDTNLGENAAEGSAMAEKCYRIIVDVTTPADAAAIEPVTLHIITDGDNDRSTNVATICRLRADYEISSDPASTPNRFGELIDSAFSISGTEVIGFADAGGNSGDGTDANPYTLAILPDVDQRIIITVTGNPVVQFDGGLVLNDGGTEGALPVSEDFETFTTTESDGSTTNGARLTLDIGNGGIATPRDFTLVARMDDAQLFATDESLTLAQTMVFRFPQITELPTGSSIRVLARTNVGGLWTAADTTNIPGDPRYDYSAVSNYDSAITLFEGAGATVAAISLNIPLTNFVTGYSLERMAAGSSPQLSLHSDGRILFVPEFFPEFVDVQSADSLGDTRCHRIIVRANVPTGAAAIEPVTIWVLTAGSNRNTAGTVCLAGDTAGANAPVSLAIHSVGFDSTATGANDAPFVLNLGEAAQYVDITASLGQGPSSPLQYFGGVVSVSEGLPYTVERRNNSSGGRSGVLRVNLLGGELSEVNERYTMEIFVDDSQSFNDEGGGRLTLYFQGPATAPTAPLIGVTSIENVGGRWTRDDDTTLPDRNGESGPVYDYTVVGNYGQAISLFSGEDSQGPALSLNLSGLGFFGTNPEQYSIAIVTAETSPELTLSDNNIIEFVQSEFLDFADLSLASPLGASICRRIVLGVADSTGSISTNGRVSIYIISASGSRSDAAVAAVCLTPVPADPLAIVGMQVTSGLSGTGDGTSESNRAIFPAARSNGRAGAIRLTLDGGVVAPGAIYRASFTEILEPPADNTAVSITIVRNSAPGDRVVISIFSGAETNTGDYEVTLRIDDSQTFNGDAILRTVFFRLTTATAQQLGLDGIRGAADSAVSESAAAESEAESDAAGGESNAKSQESESVSEGESPVFPRVSWNLAPPFVPPSRELNLQTRHSP